MVNVQELIEDYEMQGLPTEEAKVLAMHEARSRIARLRKNPLPGPQEEFMHHRFPATTKLLKRPTRNEL